MLLLLIKTIINQVHGNSCHYADSELYSYFNINRQGDILRMFTDQVRSAHQPRLEPVKISVPVPSLPQVDTSDVVPEAVYCLSQFRQPAASVLPLP